MEIAYLVRVERANLNAAGMEGNVTLLKKVRDIDGNEYVYISGVAVKYWIKEKLKELREELSPVLSKGEENPKWRRKEDQITTVGDPEKYIDDDLFGYLLPNANRKRVAPVKTNGLISIFPYTGDINIGVRYDPRYDPKGEKSHSLWDVEITNTVFRGNWLIELDRVSKFTKDEIGEEKELDVKEKESRVKSFLHAFFDLFGGAKQSSFLTSVEPRVVCVISLNKKKLVIFDRLRINKECGLDVDALVEGIKLHKDDINEIIMGVDLSSVKVEIEELKKKLSAIVGEDRVKVEELSRIKEDILSNNFKIY